MNLLFAAICVFLFLVEFKVDLHVKLIVVRITVHAVSYSLPGVNVSVRKDTADLKSKFKMIIRFILLDILSFMSRLFFAFA